MKHAAPARTPAPWLLVLLLGACGSPPPAPAPSASDPSVPVAAADAVPPDPSQLAFEREQAARAAAAEAKGHWAEAAWSWEVLSVLRPGDRDVRARAAAARQRASHEAAQRLAIAQAAQGRGDADAAAQAYLEALALDPGLQAAADALRQLELERERRRLAARSSRLGGAARSSSDLMAAVPAGNGDAVRRLNAAREHAVMLAAQGDVDGAIQLLRDALPPRADTPARNQLADLYVQKAESLRRQDPQAARQAVDAALALDRRHAGALALQRQLPAQASRPASAVRR